MAGGLSPMGTMGQGGNVHEWSETDFDRVNDLVTVAPYSTTGAMTRLARGGAWWSVANELEATNINSGLAGPGSGNENLGFRVAARTISIPEPGAIVALTAAGLLVSLRRRRFAELTS